MENTEKELETRNMLLASRYILLRIVVYVGLTLYLYWSDQLREIDTLLFSIYSMLTIAFSGTSAIFLSGRNINNLPRFVSLQLAADVVFASGLVFLLSLNSPIIIAAYAFTVVAGELVIKRRGGYVLAAASTLAYGTTATIVMYFDDRLTVGGLSRFAGNFSVLGLMLFLLAAVSAGFAVRQRVFEHAYHELEEAHDTLGQLHTAIFETSPIGLMIVEGRQLVGANPASQALELDLQSLLFDIDFNLRREQYLTVGDRQRLCCTVTRLQRRQSTAYLVTVHDITDIQRMEIALAETREFARLGQLSAGLAHDFRNVLSAIYGPAQVLEQLVQQNPKSFRALEKLVALIVTESRLFSRKISAFIEYTRPFVMFPKIHHVQPLANIIRKQLAAHLDWTPELSVVFDFQPETTTSTYWSDEQYLSRIITELVMNAFLHAEPKITEVCIKVDDTQNKKLQIHITSPNTKAPDLANRQPFKTSDLNRSGLGLTFVEKACEDLRIVFTEKLENNIRAAILEIPKIAPEC